MKHCELVDIGYKWLLKHGCAFAFKELVTQAKETPDVIGFKNGTSYLIECKTSRSDFLVDKKKPFRKMTSKGMGRYRFYLCSKDIIKVEDLPKGWGLIWTDKTGKTEVIHNPYCKSKNGNIYKGGFYKRNKDGENRMMMSALRRLQILGLVDRIYEVKSYRR